MLSSERFVGWFVGWLLFMKEWQREGKRGKEMEMETDFYLLCSPPMAQSVRAVTGWSKEPWFLSGSPTWVAVSKHLGYLPLLSRISRRLHWKWSNWNSKTWVKVELLWRGTSIISSSLTLCTTQPAATHFLVIYTSHELLKMIILIFPLQRANRTCIIRVLESRGPRTPCLYMVLWMTG